MSTSELIADGSVHRNLEFKARWSEPRDVASVVEQLGAQYVSSLLQVDTYFQVPTGRLKIRQTAGMDAELISYDRAEVTTGRWSAFRIASIQDAASVEAVLTAALGACRVVEKQRSLFLWNGCRIHVDMVKNLGLFIEFEVLSKGDVPDDRRRMSQLLLAFSLSEDDEILASYVDLLGL